MDLQKKIVPFGLSSIYREFQLDKACPTKNDTDNLGGTQ